MSEYREIDVDSARAGDLLLEAVDDAQLRHQATFLVHAGERIAVLVPAYWKSARELQIALGTLNALAGGTLSRVTSKAMEEAYRNVVSAAETLVETLDIGDA